MQISNSEWEVMRVVWATDAATSRLITEVLQAKFSWSASTIKTLLGRLVEKGFLETERQGRQFIYRSTVNEEASYTSQINHVFSRICQRQHLGLVKSVLQDLPLTEEDMIDLEALLLSKKNHLVERVPCNCLAGQCACQQEVGL